MVWKRGALKMLQISAMKVHGGIVCYIKKDHLLTLKANEF